MNPLKISQNKLFLLLLSIQLLACYSCKEKSIEIENNIVKEGELYNGIILPEEWPPKRMATGDELNMEVPYLRNPPEVINISKGRQLFVDNFLVEENTLARSFHYPKYHSSPVLAPEEEWEYTSTGAPYAAPFSDGVWYDELDKKYKMWYLTGGGKYNTDSEHLTFVTCYAESDDGVNWIKPNLNIVPGTNIVDLSPRDANTVWLDRNETDLSKRYKMFNVEFMDLGNRYSWRWVLKYSSNGIQWSKGVAQSGPIGDRSTVFYNPFLDKWVFSIRSYFSNSLRFVSLNAFASSIA